MRPFDLFFDFLHGQTDGPTGIEMQFYISMMFLGFPNEIHEEKPTDGRTDGRTDPLIEMRGRI